MMGGVTELRIDPSSPEDRERIGYVCAGWARDEVRRMLRTSPAMSGQEVLDALEADLMQRAAQLSE